MTFRPILFNAGLALMACGLAACEGGMMPFGSLGGTATFTPITTEEAFRAQVVGREVVYANGAIGAYGEDGTWTVADGDATLAEGTWEWQGERWCNQGTTAEGPVGPTCDAVAVSSTGVQFTRDDGTVGVLPFRT